jgi:hypothetical protein
MATTTCGPVCTTNPPPPPPRVWEWLTRCLTPGLKGTAARLGLTSGKGQQVLDSLPQGEARVNLANR